MRVTPISFFFFFSLLNLKDEEDIEDVCQFGLAPQTQ